MVVTSHWNSQTVTLKSESWDKIIVFITDVEIFILFPGDAPFFSAIVTSIQSEDLDRPCLPIKLQQNSHCE